VTEGGRRGWEGGWRTRTHTHTRPRARAHTDRRQPLQGRWRTVCQRRSGPPAQAGESSAERHSEHRLAVRRLAGGAGHAEREGNGSVAAAM